MTDAEHRDAAWLALTQTTISYPEWVKRRDAGRYPDITKTKWWQAFDELAKIAVEPEPPPGPAPPVLPGSPTKVLDGGGTTVAYPEAFRRGGGPFAISNLSVRRTTGYGIGSMQFYPPELETTALTTISDCSATDVRQPQPGKMGGTGEANFWIGNTTRASRLYAARTGWMGMFTGSKCHNSILEDITIEDVPVGIYIEHVTHDTVFRRFRISGVRDQAVAGGTEPGGILAARAISVEWWYGGQGSYNLTFEDGDIYCPAGADPRCGLYVGPGTYGVVVRRCRFWGPGVAMRLPLRRINNGPDVVVEDCWFEQSGEDRVYHDLPIG